jgi:hypothetical protein
MISPLSEMLILLFRLNMKTGKPININFSRFQPHFHPETIKTKPERLEERVKAKTSSHITFTET